MLKSDAKIEGPRLTSDAPDGLRIARVTAVTELGVPTVEYAGAGHAGARTTVPLDSSHVGRQVVLAFEGGRLSAPIVLGVLHEPLAELLDANVRVERDAEIDGERVVLSANREVVLRCGEASITLRRDGKVLIRGTHLLSRSSGPNRVKGASVQIN